MQQALKHSCLLWFCFFFLIRTVSNKFTHHYLKSLQQLFSMLYILIEFHIELPEQDQFAQVLMKLLIMANTKVGSVFCASRL